MCPDVMARVSSAVRTEPWNTPPSGVREDETEPAKEASRNSQGGGRK